MHEANASKASFDDIYDQPDPRSYFTVLGEFDYDIPQRAHPVFRAVLDAQADDRATVLDLGCSYGPNAALLRCDVTLGELYDRYSGDGPAGLTTEELVASDRAFYSQRRRADSPRLLGLDVATNAVSYARTVGLLDDGWVEDLETAEPSPQLMAALPAVTLITATGAVGYITEKTFGRLLAARSAPSLPWVATFALRMFPYDDIAGVLADHGLDTERLDGVTFPQRRFASEQERDGVLAAVRARGLDPAGREADGLFHSELYVSRPADQVRAQPLRELLAAASSAEHEPVR